MKFFAIGLAFTTLCAASTFAQAPAPSETTNSEASLAAGTAINATLNSTIDSKKAKPGEQFVAHTTETVKSPDGKTILPSGTKLIGHVTQASAHTNGQGQAMLAIQFDKAVLKDREEMPLHNAVIQAVAAPPREASRFNSDTDRATAPGAPSNNPSMSGSRGARPDNMPTSQSSPSGNPDGAYGTESNSAGGPLPANARGVYGFEGVRLSANANGEGTILTSSNKNVHLDGGTRLLLTVQPQSASAAPNGR